MYEEKNYDKLKENEISRIESGFTSSSEGDHTGLIHQEPDLWVKTEDVDNYINLAEMSGHTFNHHHDVNGNIRVLRVFWKSLRRIKKVKYYDEDGNDQYDYFPEDYVEDKNKGEESKFLWVNEWWEGTKISKDIYLNMRPRPIQYNRIDNPSKCHPGIVGLIYKEYL